MAKHSVFVTWFAVLTATAAVADAPAVAQAPEPADRGADWMTYNRTLQGDRYSPLKEITAANVRKLRPVATFDTGETVSFQTGPIVIDGTMYFTTYQTTYAIDAATGRRKWKRSHAVKQPGLGAHRGLAYASGVVFRGFNDGHFTAIDARTGALVWDKVISDAAKGESLPMAPIAWDGKVFVGNAGGDNFGVTGRVYALDAKTGKQIWVFNTIPDSGPAAATWTKKSPSNPPTGGALWTTFSLDPANGVLYVPTGNVAPDFAEALHPGESLYTSCILALDARSGTLLGYVQPVKHDFHDWDMAAAPAIVETRGGRQMALAGGKDGLLYGIDRTGVSAAAKKGAGTQSASDSAAAGTLPILYRTAVTRRINVKTPLSDKHFTRFAPGSQGGMEWNGPAYDPELNLVFTPVTDWATSVKLAPTSKLVGQSGKSWSGAFDAGFGRQDPKSQWGGYLTALNADTGVIRWQLRTPTPLISGVTPTAGGLVFCGDLNGQFSAHDARTGKSLWSHNTGQPIGAGVITYQVGGRQYVAVAAGLKAPIWPVKVGTARVVIYRLP